MASERAQQTIGLQVRPLTALMLAPRGSRLSNNVRIRRRASTSGTRRGAKPADNVLASVNHGRMTGLILQSMLTQETCVGSVVTIPTVSLDVISLVAESCGYYRGHIEQRVAH